MKESFIEFTTNQGVELEGRLVHLGRFDVVTQVSIAGDVLRTSEVVPQAKIVSSGRVVYAGRAIVRTVVDSVSTTTFELSLEEPGVAAGSSGLANELSYEGFTRHWLAEYRILPEMKVVVSDVSILLSNLKGWFDHVEVMLNSGKSGNDTAGVNAFFNKVAPQVIRTFNSQHERFEEIAYRVDPELRSAHRNFVWRNWSEFFLCTPFGDRTFRKPLGYAGDYEMMNMIHRNAPEGRSLFVRTLHCLLVSQWPAESVRNRIAHLKENLVAETARVVREGRKARVMNLGCGPAWEVQEFIKESPLSNECDFTLMDFNEETVNYTGKLLTDLMSTCGRRGTITMRQASVQQLLRSALQGKAIAGDQKYDLIYCAGLFDYLSDATCKAVVGLFCKWLQAGGLVVVANMNDSKPFRNFIEYILDWNLIYRDSQKLARWAPTSPQIETRIIAEPTTVNLFLHSRQVD